MKQSIGRAFVGAIWCLSINASGSAPQAPTSGESIASAVTVKMTADLTSLSVVDASRVVAGLADGRVAIWNGRDATTINVPAHKARVLAVGVTPDKRRVLSVASDGSLAESPMAQGAAARTARVDFGVAPTRAAMFSPDGSRLITGGEFGDVRVYDVESGKLRREMRGHLTEIQDLAFYPRLTLIASASADTDVRIWDGSSGRVAGLVESDVSMFALAFNPRDGTLASGGADRRVTFRNPTAYAPAGVVSLQAPKMVATLAWSPDGRLLAIGDVDDATLSKGGLQIVAVSTRTVVATLDTGGEPANRIVFFADGNRLAAIIGRTLRAWNLDVVR